MHGFGRIPLLYNFICGQKFVYFPHPSLDTGIVWVRMSAFIVWVRMSAFIAYSGSLHSRIGLADKQ